MSEDVAIGNSTGRQAIVHLWSFRACLSFAGVFLAILVLLLDDLSFDDNPELLDAKIFALGFFFHLTFAVLLVSLAFANFDSIPVRLGQLFLVAGSVIVLFDLSMAVGLVLEDGIPKQSIGKRRLGIQNFLQWTL